MSTLALLVVLLCLGFGLTVIFGLGFLAFHRPRLKGPIMVSLTATMALLALLAWVTQAGALTEGAGPGHPVAPTVWTGR
ncbi:hypothetical protein NGM36_04805 [Streptomyces mutabilis]|uniref:hypothetical protein n=1 Tax=Streptomyces mutabilis TaxID=67332 RepID=UPI0022BA3598|nr:hypothetical protein [Streptomyces mutabilis]MCZ9349118.1 hypothetical protein [Streptomyces mutabilis]